MRTRTNPYHGSELSTAATTRVNHAQNKIPVGWTILGALALSALVWSAIFELIF